MPETDNTPQVHVPALPKIRFRVQQRSMGIPYGEKWVLVDQEGCQWVSGRSFGFFPRIEQYPSLYYDTEAEAWANVPKSGWEILAPDTPLYCIDLFEDGARSGLGYYRYYTLIEPDMTREPVAFEHLTGAVMIPDIKRYRRYEVRRA